MTSDEALGEEEFLRFEQENSDDDYKNTEDENMSCLEDSDGKNTLF